jgi:hypothetical protein
MQRTYHANKKSNFKLLSDKEKGKKESQETNLAPMLHQHRQEIDW